MVEGVVRTVTLGSLNSAWEPWTGVISIMSMLPAWRASACACVSSLKTTWTPSRYGSPCCQYFGFFFSVALCLGLYSVSMNGPVPTGFFCQVPAL